MHKTRSKPLQLIKDRGCGILVFMLITLPIWALSISLKGPLFSAGLLVVMLVIVFLIATLHTRKD